MSSSVDPAFDGILATCLGRLESDGPAALEAMCTEHPDQADRLRRRVKLLVSANLIDLATSFENLPARLGDFEPLERIGAGAMGVVHRARQISTGRQVALKLIRPELLAFPGSHARFQREVELSARLHHPAILPVLGVGETEGVPWFAMELVHGTSLAAVLQELRERGCAPGQLQPDSLTEIVRHLTPPDLRGPSGPAAESTWRSWVLRAVRQIAAALVHAHEKGVLHRDVKPSNVLLAVDGRLFLSDFGLASDAGDGTLSRSHSAVGSLPYMAPEVHEGQSADARSDVYGIGVLLYELLTLRHPFEGSSSSEIFRAILAGKARAPREHWRRITQDDQAVVLRALQRRPAQRYATAAELVEDLDHLLARRLPRARPAGPLARAVRLAQRRPLRALTISLGALVLVAGPLGWWLHRMQTALDLADAYESEHAAHDRSERHFLAALQAIGHVLGATATNELEDVPRMQTARLRAVDQALELFPELERDRPDDERVALERARLHATRAEVLYDLGRLEPARAECRLAEERIARLLSTDPTDERLLLSADVHNLHAKLEQASLHYDVALELQRAGVAQLRLASADAGRDPAHLRGLVVLLANQAESEVVVHGPEVAAATLAQALEAAHALAEAHPDQARYLWPLGRVTLDLAELELARGEHGAALELAQESLEIHRAASQLALSERYYVFEVGAALQLLARLHGLDGDHETEQARLREALGLVEGLLRDFPDSTRYQREQGQLHDRLAGSLLRQGRLEEATQLLELALQEYEDLLARSAESCDARIRCARAANNLANTLIMRRLRLEEAVTLLERGLVHLASCAGLSAPMDVAALENSLRYLRALALCLSGDLERARSAVQDLDDRAGSDPQPLRYVADLWNEWLLALLASGSAPEQEALARTRTLEALARAIDAGYRDLAELRSNPALSLFHSDPEFEGLLERAAR